MWAQRLQKSSMRFSAIYCHFTIWFRLHFSSLVSFSFLFTWLLLTQVDCWKVIFYWFDVFMLMHSGSTGFWFRKLKATVNRRFVLVNFVIPSQMTTWWAYFYKIKLVIPLHTVEDKVTCSLVKGSWKLDLKFISILDCLR